MQIQYYIDNYSGGSPRNIKGPFDNLMDARAECNTKHEASVDAYDGVVEQLEENGGSASLVEAWSATEDSEDYQAIYSVTK
jgi:hypothetical protein